MASWASWRAGASFLGNHVTFPQFAVPYYLDRPPTGELAFDVVPILTMAACLPTLSLFLARKDFNNLALYGLGFVVAVVYHALQLGAHNGLASTRFIGIDGAGWRTIDIFFANILLARTFGHALNVDHPLIAALPNIALPVGIVTLLTTYPGITLSLCARVTAGAMLLTLLLQLGWEGRALLHQLRVQYQDRYMVAALLAMAMGIVLFAMPTYQPEQYWFYHSAWHCMMGWGYIWLYQGLMDRHWVAWRKVRGAQAAVSAAAGFAQAGAARRSRQQASAQDLYAMDTLNVISTSKNTAVNGHGRTDSAGSAEALGAGLQQACKDTASTPAAKGAALRAAVATTQSEAQSDMGPQHEDMEGRCTRRRRSARRL